MFDLDPGVSYVTAAGLIVHLPLGTLTGPRAASLAGLAPVTRESGARQGKGAAVAEKPAVAAEKASTPR